MTQEEQETAAQEMEDMYVASRQPVGGHRYRRRGPVGNGDETRFRISSGYTWRAIGEWDALLANAKTTSAADILSSPAL
ncbi:MAG: hypothetical protein ACLR23_19770 [Clostridia bacterium]